MVVQHGLPVGKAEDTRSAAEQLPALAFDGRACPLLKLEKSYDAALRTALLNGKTWIWRLCQVVSVGSRLS